MHSSTARSRSEDLKIQYFVDTDTLYVLLNETPVADTRDLDENTLLDIDGKGNLIGFTIEHAKARADITNLVFQQIPEPSST